MNVFKKITAAVAVTGASVGSAFAALPAGVDASITSASADGLLIVGGLAVAGAAVFLIHKLLKRFGLSM